MRTDSLFHRYEIFVATAVIAAHANFLNKGFRQKDIRFLIELFSNWVEFTLEGSIISLNNTQVSRYIEELVNEGFAKRIGKGITTRPKYRLTRMGLIDLLGRLVKDPAYIEPAHFFFIYYFIYNYKPRLLNLIKSEGSRFPIATQLEVEDLLDVNALVENQRKRVVLEIKKLHSRISDSKQSSQIAQDLYRKGMSGQEVAKRIENVFPYGLNSQKPLNDLFSEIPQDIGQWELEEGAQRRCEQIWNPARTILNSYLQQLNKLL